MLLDRHGSLSSAVIDAPIRLHQSNC